MLAVHTPRSAEARDATLPAAAWRWLAPAVLASGLALTAGFAAWAWQRGLAEHQTRFERAADLVVRALNNRVQAYMDMLPGLRALAASGEVDDAAFARHARSISLERRFPGVARSFIADRVGGEERAAYVSRVRADHSLVHEGHPDFDIRPPGARLEHLVIRHVNPPDPGVLGYDLFDPDQDYRADVTLALRSDADVATGPLLLVRDRGAALAPSLTSVAIRVGVHRSGSSPESPAQREREAIGVVGVAFRTTELLRSALPAADQAWLHVRVNDVDAMRTGKPAQIFDSSWIVPDARRAETGRLQRVELSVADRRWTIEIGEQLGAVPVPLSTTIMLAIVLSALLFASLALLTHRVVGLRADADRQRRDADARLAVQRRQSHDDEQRLRMLFEHSFDAMLHARPDGTLLAANPAACRLFGRTEADLCSGGCTGILDAGDERFDAWRAACAQADQVQGRMRLRRANGKCFEAELSSQAFIDASGVAAVHVIVRDLDETDRATARHTELTAVLDAMPDFVGSADHTGRITFLNGAARRMLGLAPDAPLGTLSFADCHPEWAARTVMEVAIPSAQSNGVWAGQLAIACADGRELPVSQVIICQRDPQGRILRLSTVARDLTEVQASQARQRSLEAQLLEAQKMESIGTLAGGVAHDFNNVLAAILGNLTIAREDLDAEHVAQRPLALAQQAATRARALVQQILAFSRRLPQRRAVQPLAPVVEEALALLRSTLPGSVTLNAFIDTRPMMVEVDANQIQQVLLNLCTNSLQALPAHAGSIRVEAMRTDEGDARLSVIDDGTGMDEATRARIFEPFFTTKPVGQGTGLGLAVVHGIVTGSGGRILVDSKPGSGTRIDVLLPLCNGAPPPAPEATHAANAPRGHGEHLLLADDDEVVGLTAEALLRRAGYRVTRVSSGLAAIEAVRASPREFALVVTDYNMPGISGLTVAEHLAAVAPGLPVIITSGFVTDELIEAARALGVRNVLLKEYSHERMAEAVREAIGMHAI